MLNQVVVKLPKLLAALLAALLLACAAAACSSEREPIVFSELNWPSAEIQTRIVRFIVEHGYGYPTESIAGSTEPLWQRLLDNETDVALEVWLPNQQEVWESALAEGVIVDAGTSLQPIWQGFVIPQYVKDEHPGLVAVTDLPDYAALFAAPDSSGRARLVDCVEGWFCAQDNAAKIAAYGLTEHVELAAPDSAAALFEGLERAYERGDAWLGYMWGPTPTAAALELYLLEEPAYSDACWAAGKGCAYPETEVRIAVHQTLAERAPEVLEFLERWEFDEESQIAAEVWMAEQGESAANAALWYLRNRRAVWSAYLSEETAGKVDAALADTE